MKAHLFSIIFFFSSFYLYSQTVTLDSSFGNGGIVITPTSNSAEIVDIAIQSDGKIVAAGYNLGGDDVQVARYHADGTLDIAFGTGGIVITDIGNQNIPYSMLLQADGKIVVGGTYLANSSPPFEYHSSLIRYNTDGTLDNTFGTGGVVKTIADSYSDGIASIALQTDGKIITAGHAANQCLIMRYNSNGTIDSSFGNNGIVKTSVEATEQESSHWDMALQTDDKIIACGRTTDGDNGKFSLVRYNSDGSLDQSFGTGGKVVTDFEQPWCEEIAARMETQNDGKIFLAGYYAPFSGTCNGSTTFFARYNSNGLLDSTFAIGGKLSSNIFPPPTDIALQNDEKIIISGSVMVSNYSYSILRFNPDGSIDSTFGNSGNIIIDIAPGNDYAQCLKIQPDNKIIVAGSSRDSSSVPAHFTILRLTSDLTNTISILPSDDYCNLYPNPFTNFITVSISKPLNDELFFELYSIIGQRILKKKMTTQELNINVSELASGIYTYKVSSKNEIKQTGKLIKQ